MHHEPGLLPRTRLLAPRLRLAWIALLAAAALPLAWTLLQPRSTPVGPTAAVFSAPRALAHVRALAAAPRPVGGDANRDARDYLVRQIRILGLEPEIQTETVRTATVDLTSNVRVTVAVVHNVLARLPGTVRRHRAPDGSERPAAALAVARYDSGAATLGAANGAMSAAALLETLRVLRAAPPPDNDLLFLFTDADGPQGLGSRGFVQSHPWLRHARVALRFDNDGNRGPLELVDASQADAYAIDGWAQAAPQAHASSFMGELYGSLQQRPAAAPLAAAGVPLLHFATTGGTLGPGGAWDVPDRLSGASLQHEGDTMLALLRHFGAAVPPTMDKARGQVVLALPGLGHVHYSYGLARALALLAWVLTALCCRRALGRMRIAGTDLTQAAFGFLFMACLATFLSHLCWEGLPELRRHWDLGQMTMDACVRWEILAFLLLPAALFAPLQRHLQRRVGTPAVALGVLIAGTAALTGVIIGAPGASGVLAWPLLAAQAGWLAMTARRPPAHARAVALAACLPAALLLAPAAYDSLAYLSPTWLVLPAMLACLLAGLYGPLLAGVRMRFVFRPLMLGAAACIGLAAAANPRAPALPAPNQLMYWKDTPSWQAFWMYPPAPLDAWTRSIFPNCLHPYQLPYMFGVSSSPVWYAAAKRNDSVAYPDLIILKDEQRGHVRHIEFRMRSKNRAPEIRMRLAGAHPLRSSVNGYVITDTKHRGWSLDLHGMEDRDLLFSFDLHTGGNFMVFIQERIPGLPVADLPPRPAGLEPALLPGTGTTISADILLFR